MRSAPVSLSGLLRGGASTKRQFSGALVPSARRPGSMPQVVGGTPLLAICIGVISSCRCETSNDQPTATSPAPTAAASSVAQPDAASPAHTAAPTPTSVSSSEPPTPTLPPNEQRRHLLTVLEAQGFSSAQLREVEQTIDASDRIGFGNPKASRPALSSAECIQRRRLAEPLPADPTCGAPYMVRVPPVRGATEQSDVCIDQFEFPNVPCEFPLVWTTPNEAAELCGALGKRLCDAHEWEGACAGDTLSPNEAYAWNAIPKMYARGPARERRLSMERHNNVSRELVWAYGKQSEPELCATDSAKSPGCTDVDYDTCGTNAYPTGSFPACVSASGVYDQHGNVAEHLSLPLYPEELGGKGWTEMKGSWFIFAHSPTHADDCRWRARNWHTTRVGRAGGHRSYHLGFRCCRDRD